jgi:alkylation response protein AidB-like acyl-CoA dehydrogenase
MDFFAALYFALTVLSTVGFGDITPVGTVARGLTMVQMTLDLVLLGVAVRVITGAAQRARDRKQRATAPISDKQDPQEPSSS